MWSELSGRFCLNIYNILSLHMNHVDAILTIFWMCMKSVVRNTRVAQRLLECDIKINHLIFLTLYVSTVSFGRERQCIAWGHLQRWSKGQAQALSVVCVVIPHHSCTSETLSDLWQYLPKVHLGKRLESTHYFSFILTPVVLNTISGETVPESAVYFSIWIVFLLSQILRILNVVMS